MNQTITEDDENEETKNNDNTLVATEDGMDVTKEAISSEVRGIRIEDMESEQESTKEAAEELEVRKKNRLIRKPLKRLSLPSQGTSTIR